MSRGISDSAGPFPSILVIFGVDDVEPGDLLLRLSEGTVGDKLVDSSA